MKYKHQKKNKWITNDWSVPLFEMSSNSSLVQAPNVFGSVTKRLPIVDEDWALSGTSSISAALLCKCNSRKEVSEPIEFGNDWRQLLCKSSTTREWREPNAFPSNSMFERVRIWKKKKNLKEEEEFERRRRRRRRRFIFDFWFLYEQKNE